MASFPLLTRAWWRTFVFRLIGALSSTKHVSGTPLPEKPNRILVLTPVLRGDYIVLSPLISGLRKLRPSSELAVVITRPSHDLAQADPNVDKVILYNKLPRWFHSIHEVFRYHPDIVVLPKGHPAFTETMLVLLSRARYRVGLSHPHHNSFLTHAVAHRGEREHRTTAYARLLKPFGADPATISRRLHIGEDPVGETKATVWFEDHPGPWVALNLSAGASTRLWPLERWSQLIVQLHDLYPKLRFLTLGVGPQAEECQQLAESFDYVETIKTGSFLEAVAFVARCSLLVSPDTGTVHASAARQVPVFVLYNGDRENYIRFSPASVQHDCVFAEEGQDVNSLSVPDVFNKLAPFIKTLGIE